MKKGSPGRQNKAAGLEIPADTRRTEQKKGKTSQQSCDVFPLILPILLSTGKLFRRRKTERK
jgi:hypothetical protein